MKTNQFAIQSIAQIPLVEIKNNQPMTTSVQVADVFERNHKDILRSIENLVCSNDFQERNFALLFNISNLANGGYKKLPFYYITRDGFTFLAMGFTGKKAAHFKEWYISEFNRMEALLHQQAIDQAVAAVRPVLQVPKVKYRYRTRIVPAAI